MAQLRNGMRALTLDASSPAATITKLNLLLENYIDVPFATLAYIALDPETHAVTLASAGHPPPLVLGPGGQTLVPRSRPAGCRSASTSGRCTPTRRRCSSPARWSSSTPTVSWSAGAARSTTGSRTQPGRPNGRRAPGSVRRRARPGSAGRRRAVRRRRGARRLPESSARAARSRDPGRPQSRTYAPSSSGGLPAPPCLTSTRATYCPHGRQARTRSSTPGGRGRGARPGRGDALRRSGADPRGGHGPLEAGPRGPRARPASHRVADGERRRRAGATGTNVVMERPLTRGPARGHAAHPAEH